MRSYKDICDYLVNRQITDDKIYYLGDKKLEIQKDINEIIYNNGKSIVSNDENDMIIDRILLPRIMVIKKEIKKLIIDCGYDVSKINALCDKVEYINGKNIDINKKNKINELYQEFIIIRNGIWNYHLYLLNDILSKYHDDTKYDDIYQEAGIALMNAIEKYDDGNFNFKNFATYYIKYNIDYHYRDLDLYLSMPVNKMHLYYKLHKAVEYYIDKYHKMPNREDIMNMIKITSKTLSTFLALSRVDFISLDDVIYQEDEYIMALEIFSQDNDIRQVENKAIGENLKNTLDEMLMELTDRERIVINDYYLKEDSLDYYEITKKLGVSYGTTMNLRRRALTKLSRHKDELGKYLR